MSDAVAAQSPAFELTGDQRQIGDLAAEIAQREIAPHIAQWDREHYFPRDLFTKLTAAGIMGLLIPEEYGGSGADYVSYARAIEELARVDAGSAVTVSVHSMICMAILKLGSEGQKREYLPKLAAGRYDCGLCAHGTRCRIRCGEHSRDRKTYGWRLRAERTQAVVHERQLFDGSDGNVPLRGRGRERRERFPRRQ